MPRFFPACAVPCLADIYPLRLRLNGALFGLLLGGALPQLAVGLSLGAFPVGGALPRLAVGLPLGAFPVGGALPRLAVGLPLGAFPVGDALPQLAVGLPLGAFPVGGALPQLAVGLRSLGVLPATTTVAPVLCRCSRRAPGPEGEQPRLKMRRGAANSASPRIGGYG